MKKGKILIVEDEEGIQFLLKDILDEEGYEVLIANNGVECLDILKKDIPDIIILDCEMPKMDGFETIKAIRESSYWSNIPVIFLTVRSKEKDQIFGIELGADDYIVKPFNKKILLGKINILLKRKEINLNLNPLTKLPGNIMIQQEFERRILKDIPFVVLYIDLNNFKAYNDYYGFYKGDRVIKHTAEILVSIKKEFEKENIFVGHIGGDDFIIISPPYLGKILSKKIIDLFDSTVVDFYSEEDLKRGYISTYNRQGEMQKFNIMSISIVIISSERTKIIHYGEMSQRAAELKKYAKQFNRSFFVEERRGGEM